MLTIGLTGGIATGKSVVLAHFASLGLATIDADLLARQTVQPGTEASAQIVARFGTNILKDDGQIDRAALGRKVFADSAARKDLESIIHPRVYSIVEDWLLECETHGERAAIVAIPLLFETGHDKEFKRILVVSCDPQIQLQRLIARDDITESEAKQRIATQWTTEQKIARADIVIRTDESINDTHKQVEQIFRNL
jgi:dephospho-CoA kinase|tara:strand:- start:1733 stop:2320 length:588 start_codon:yes stop_codon:yes gene_type:complete